MKGEIHIGLEADPSQRFQSELDDLARRLRARRRSEAGRLLLRHRGEGESSGQTAHPRRRLVSTFLSPMG